MMESSEKNHNLADNSEKARVYESVRVYNNSNTHYTSIHTSSCTLYI